MTVSSTNTDYNALVAGMGSASASGDSTAKEIGDRFLKLLVTQLKNQDPMNPMENAELTSQLAQMSTVEGIGKLNTTLAEMARASQMTQGASLVGRSVLAEGEFLELTSAGAIGAVDLDSRADSVKVSILDAKGVAVRVLDLGAQESGLVRFGWDGKDAAGNLLGNGTYQFQLTASAAGSAVEATPYGMGSVLSVSLNDSSGLDVEVSGLGVLGLDKIRQVY